MKRTCIYRGESEFTRYKIIDGIYEGRMARVLFSGSGVPQSGVALDDEPALLFDYNQRIVEMAHSMQPQSILIIGGGAFTLPTALRQQLPHCQVDVVEIDELLPEIASTYFSLEVDDKLAITIGDGAAYIASCDSRYDLIVIDAFVESKMVEALFTPPVIADYVRCLQPGGMIAVNFISKYYTRHLSLSHTLLAAFEAQCVAVELYPADYQESRHTEQNIILVASPEALPALDYLHSAPVQLPAVRRSA